MTAKEYLQQPFKAAKNLAYEIERLTRLRAAAESVPTRQPSAPASATAGLSRTESAALKVLEQEEAVTQAFLRFADLQKEVAAAIDKLRDQSEQLVLKYRYVCLQPWPAVAESMNLSPSHAYRLHHSAAQNFASIYAKKAANDRQ